MQVIRLGQENCRDCYKCIRNCLLKAITYSDGHAEIIPQECIQCGECVVTCPRNDNVKLEWNDLELVRWQILTGRKVIASVAPSFISDFDVGSIEDMREMLMKLGFADAQETAIGAEIVSAEYVKMMASGEVDVLISSSCPPINMLIQKYYPEMLQYLAKVESPMEVHCRMLREANPDAFIVFIGPCYAKKSEAMDTGCCDAVLLFSDVKKWMKSYGMTTINRGIGTIRGGYRARRYARQDGIVKSFTREPGWNRVSIDGVGDCIAALDELRQSRGKLSKVFLEMTACEGSCVNGPDIRTNRYENRIRGTVKVNSYAGENDYGIRVDRSIRKAFEPDPVGRVMPSEEEIERVLDKLGMGAGGGELNCGCCGYPTCREMASALCQGKAQLDMCLPYLRERAERHSREIVDNTLAAADEVIEKQMRVAQNIASILGETTAETKVMLVKLKEAIQDSEKT